MNSKKIKDSDIDKSYLETHSDTKNYYLGIHQLPDSLSSRLYASFYPKEQNPLENFYNNFSSNKSKSIDNMNYSSGIGFRNLPSIKF